MTNKQREAIELAKEFTEIDFSNPMGWTGYYDTELKELSQAIDTVLSLIKENSAEIQQKNTELAEKSAELEKKDKQIDLIKEYVHQEIAHCTETIKDYIDDDKEGNKHYIKELKEEREHWRDIEKILQNKQKEELYMNWWKYGLYE